MKGSQIMKKVKKLVSLLLSTAIAASMSVMPMSGAQASWENDEDVINLLSELNIMNGDDDGNYRLDDYVSRAEFAKMAVASSSSKDTIATGLSFSPFMDVPSSSWAAPYIQAAVDAGICQGYIDGTFQPGNQVNYAEAVTMLMRVLGYSDDDFGVSWPHGQIGLADNLEMSKNVNAGAYDALTRRQVARLIYNTLDTKKKDTQTKLITVFDCKIIEGVTIVASKKEDSSLGTDKIFTTAGTFEFDNNFNYDYVGRQGDIVIKNDKDFISFRADEQNVTDYGVTNIIGSDLVLDGTMLDINENTTTYYKSQTMTYSNAVQKAEKGDTFRIVTNPNGSIDYALLIDTHSNSNLENNALDKYVIYSLLNDAIVCYSNGSMSQIKVQDTTTCYRDKTPSTYGAVKNSMEMGDIVYVKMNGSEIDYISFEKGNMQGPIKVVSDSWANSYSGNASTQYMRDGNKVSADDIKINDVIYYSSDLNMVLAYSNKVTGVYENASPSRDTPNRVTISGKEYAVEGVEAFNDLSSSGSFRFGDTITVILGKDGDIAGVVTSSSSSTTSQTGFVTAAGKKNFNNSDGTTYSSYYLDLVSADGSQYEYAVTSNCENYVSSVCRVSFAGDKTTVTRLSTSDTGSSSVSGIVNSSKGTIGNDELADNVKILDTLGTTKNDTPAYKRIYPQRLDGLRLSSSQVRFVSKNSAGQIEELILNDATGDCYEYGLVTSITDASGQKTYKIDVDGVSNVVSGSFSVGIGMPCRARVNGQSLSTVTSLGQYKGSFSQLTSEYAVIGGNKYKLSDKVVVYKNTGIQTYDKISLNDAISGSYTYTAYYDRAESSGGRIRIIIVTDK